jgi:hypothetical protein
MQSEYSADPFQLFVPRYSSLLVLVAGFSAAFLLGLFLWDLTGGRPVNSGPIARGADPRPSAVEVIHEGTGPAQPAETEFGAGLSPAFTAEVRRWEPQIIGWAAEFGLDPNLVATVMQIESCGNPQAVSSAGAQGLFQVMPFHFAEGEEMRDPETNARRGLGYLVQSLALTEGHVGMALAGYNGGQAAAQGSWESWPLETRRYYRWASGIYHDVQSGLADSPTLHEWLAAGGSSLCQQAAGLGF